MHVQPGEEREVSADHFSHPIDELYIMLGRIFQGNDMVDPRVQKMTIAMVFVLGSVGFATNAAENSYAVVVKATEAASAS